MSRFQGVAIGCGILGLLVGTVLVLTYSREACVTTPSHWARVAAWISLFVIPVSAGLIGAGFVDLPRRRVMGSATALALAGLGLVYLGAIAVAADYGCHS